MATVNTTTKVTPWGDDNHEKLSDKPQRSTIGFGQQLKGLLRPDNMIDQMMGKRNSAEQSPTASKEAKKKSNETVVFSLQAKKEQESLQKETQMVLQKLKEQIVLLEKSERNLSADLAKVKVEHVPAKTGIYYIRFLEWLLTVVQQLRMKVDQGRAWLETFNQRKKKKMGYWQKYKKHGTTFGLSHERSLATQTG